jgi:hypothetical protein
MILSEKAIIYLNSTNKFICVMVKCGVLFEVRAGFLNNIYTSFYFKGLNYDLSFLICFQLMGFIQHHITHLYTA